MQNAFQPLWKEKKECLETIGYTGSNDGLSIRGAKRILNLMSRVAAFVATPFAALATVYLAVSLSPLALAGIVVTVLLYDTYQLTRAIEYYWFERPSFPTNSQIMTCHTFVFKHL